VKGPSKGEFWLARYRKIPFLVPEVGQFSNAKSFLLDQLIAETKTDLKSSSSPLFDPVLF
jgi:hypothetical protein